MILRLTAATAQAMRAHAARDFPREACGLILGPAGAAGAVTGDEAVPSANLAPAGADDTFEIDTALHLAVQRQARAAGRRVVGLYHSHPGAPPIPSGRDAAGAWDESLIWVIIATDIAGAGEIRGWVPAGGTFTEWVIEVVP
ncbi:Mov34/MPN/PAD-1 family protein [Oleomonas cavernae]|uniref:Mov34/MPN/PAD-1 family protein n=1 Tax=Oleomonas cavernae TaxID=2320859 RepID=UPI0013145AB1|nr:M67 family metallopeptidase [Oleomonas cavernae]